MSTMELVPYSETRRDQVERDLYEKPEIHYERRDGLVIQVYWLRLLNEISMSLMYQRRIREFGIPNDKVNDAIAHPEAYAALQGMFRVETIDE